VNTEASFRAGRGKLQTSPAKHPSRKKKKASFKLELGGGRGVTGGRGVHLVGAKRKKEKGAQGKARVAGKGGQGVHYAASRREGGGGRKLQTTRALRPGYLRPDNENLRPGSQ